LVNVDKVQVIVGGSCSSETIPAGKIAQQNEVVLISPTASSPEVSQIGEYVWRYWNDVDAGAVMVDFLEQEAESIALIYENTDYAAAYANVIRETFAGEIVIDEKFATEEKDFSILAKNVVDSADEVDYIVYIPQSEATMISFVKALQGEGAWDERKDKFI
jgi:branched-chain amino acid transport system substrate-binding protein